MSAPPPDSFIRYEDELKRRLEKLSRNYDFTTMKIFVAVECLGERLVYSLYDKDKKNKWTMFLERKEACRLDLTKHDKNRDKYCEFLSTISREDQSAGLQSAMLTYFQNKGAVDAFKTISSVDIDGLNTTFVGHFCRLFERKLDSWFESYKAIAVRLTGHVKVSNFVRVLCGQIDLICQREGRMYAVCVKVTELESLRPVDIAEICLCKILLIQNGLADPNSLKLAFLVVHLNADRPILRLWEYTPSEEMEQSMREADIDKLIDAGKLSQYHEFWKENVSVYGSWL